MKRCSEKRPIDTVTITIKTSQSALDESECISQRGRSEHTPCWCITQLQQPVGPTERRMDPSCESVSRSVWRSELTHDTHDGEISQMVRTPRDTIRHFRAPVMWVCHLLAGGWFVFSCWWFVKLLVCAKSQQPSVQRTHSESWLDVSYLYSGRSDMFQFGFSIVKIQYYANFTLEVFSNNNVCL